MPHVSRRSSILSLFGAVVGIWAAPRVSDAVAEWMTAPPVELRSTTLPEALPVGQAPVAGARAATKADATATGAAATINAGMRFTMAGLTCAPPRGTGEVQVRLRTSEDGRTWSRWYALALERVAEEGGGEGLRRTIWTGAGRYLQVCASTAGEGEYRARAPARREQVPSGTSATLAPAFIAA